MSIADRRVYGLQLVYSGDDTSGYRLGEGYRPPSINFLTELFAGWREIAPLLHFTVPCSFPELAEQGFADAWLSEFRRADMQPFMLELGVDPLHPPPQEEHLVSNLTQLREAEVGLCQLDFGAGYATLATWPRVPFTRVELHPQFAQPSDTAGSMLRSLREMFASFDLTSSVRGVADEEQLQLLAAHDYQLARGPAVGSAMRPIEVDHWLRENKSRVGQAPE